jgi:two-component sensor histidine kinase
MQNIDGNQVRLVTHAPSVKLELGQAVPSALLVNELLTNSVKHAFPSGMPGTITVSFDSDEQGYRLQVTDDGVGLPEGPDLSRSTSMGLQLVYLLAEQLHGTVEIQRNKGTQFLIVFPRPNAVQGESPH